MGTPGWGDEAGWAGVLRQGGAEGVGNGLAAAPAAAEAVGLAGRRVGGRSLDHGANGVIAATADRAGSAGLGDLLGRARARVDGVLDGAGGNAKAETDVHLRSRAPR